MKTQNNGCRYIIYARKSTDEKGKQVRSIKDQLTELRAFIKRIGDVEVVDIVIEKRSARYPGRPEFNRVMKMIQEEKADGLIAWHPNRLTRNATDSMNIINLLDSGQLKDMMFPTFPFENTPYGINNLFRAFADSKLETDKLVVDIKRGLYLKAKEGRWPGFAPLGFKNRKGTGNIYIDKKRAPLITKMYELYSTGKYTLRKIKMIIDVLGMTNRNSNKLALSAYQGVLKNPFYYGVMRYGGELYSGKHKPLISKKLFDRVQRVMEQKGRRKNLKILKDFLYRGIVKCGVCGCAITVMKKVKKSKREYTYYFCTRKNPTQECNQNIYTREEVLSVQMKAAVQKVSLPDGWADWMVAELEKEKEHKAHASDLFAQKIEKDLNKTEQKLDRLIDALAEETLTDDEFRKAKNKIINKKQELKEKKKDFEQKGYNWLEPAITFIKAYKQREIASLIKNCEKIRDKFQKVGSNPCLKGNQLSVTYKKPFSFLAEAEPERSEGEVVKGKIKKSSLLWRWAELNRRAKDARKCFYIYSLLL